MPNLPRRRGQQWQRWGCWKVEAPIYIETSLTGTIWLLIRWVRQRRGVSASKEGHPQLQRRTKLAVQGFKNQKGWQWLRTEFQDITYCIEQLKHSEKKYYSCSTWHQNTVIIRQLRSLTLSSTKKLVDRFLSIKETSWCRHISVWRSWWWGWKLWHIVHCTIYSISRYMWHICVFWHGALHLTREQDDPLQRDLNCKEPGICQHDKHNK